MPTETEPEPQSVRAFLPALEATGGLVRVAESVDPRFELSAFLHAASGGPALLFERVAGSELRALGNVLNSRGRIARALGCTVAEIVPRLLAAIRAPVVPRVVAGGAVQEVVIDRDPLASLPLPTFFEKESRPYVTAGAIVTRDPETGAANLSFARLGQLDGSRALIGIAPNHHLALYARKAAARGETLPIAVTIGTHPAIQLAACLYLGVGDDEMGCAGALLGRPVDVVRALGADLMVPADGEIVIEGRIDARVPVVEGLISEYHGLYEDYGPGILATFDRVTRRRDAIFQVIEPGFSREHILLGALPIAAGLRDAVARVVPNVGDVAVTDSRGCRTDVVIQIAEPRPGQARRAMMAAWAAVSIVKRITVVDDDVDPWDPLLVDWARVNRCKIERDLLVIPDAGCDRSEPLEAGGLVIKWGIDATAKSGDRREGTERALPPAAALARAQAWFARAGIDPAAPR